MAKETERILEEILSAHRKQNEAVKAFKKAQQRYSDALTEVMDAHHALAKVEKATLRILLDGVLNGTL